MLPMMQRLIVGGILICPICSDNLTHFMTPTDRYFVLLFSCICTILYCMYVSTRTWKFPVCISFSPICEWVPEYIWGFSYLCLGSSFHFLMILLDVVFWRVTLSPLRPIVSNFILSLHHPSPPSIPHPSPQRRRRR